MDINIIALTEQFSKYQLKTIESWGEYLWVLGQIVFALGYMALYFMTWGYFIDGTIYASYYLIMHPEQLRALIISSAAIYALVWAIAIATLIAALWELL